MGAACPVIWLPLVPGVRQSRAKHPEPGGAAVPRVLSHILQHFLCRISPRCLVGAGLWVPVAPGPPWGGRVVGFPSVLCSGHV